MSHPLTGSASPGASPVSSGSPHRRPSCSTRATDAPVDDVREVRSVTAAAAHRRSTPRSNNGQTILEATLAVLGKPCDLLVWSGWRDSNPRPPAPKAGALTKLRYIPWTSRSLPSHDHVPRAERSESPIVQRSQQAAQQGPAPWSRPFGDLARAGRRYATGVAALSGASRRGGCAGVAQWQSPSLPSWS
jgi:hypothetical protein